MARIILDSDDEEQSPPPGEATLLAAKQPEALTNEANGSLSDHTERQTNSTSSTELLRQEIQKAHDALVEPTPSNKRTMEVNSKISPASPSVKPPKRRKTAIVTENHPNDDDTMKVRRATSVNPVTSTARQSSSGLARSNGAAITGSSGRDGKSARQETVTEQREHLVDEWEVPKSSGPDQDSHISTKVKSRSTVRQTIVHGVEALPRESVAMAGHVERNEVGTSGSQLTTTLQKHVQATNGQPVQDVLSSPSRKRIRRRATIHQSVVSESQEYARSSISPTATRLDSAARGVMAEDGCARPRPTDLSTPKHTRASNISVKITHKTSQEFIASGLQDDFVAHQPISMFPGDSSTVPDNTLSQQRLLQVALAESETLVVEQAKTSARLHDTDSCSIPSSAFVNTPSRPTNPSTGSTSGHTEPATATKHMETLIPQVRVDPAPGSGPNSPAGKAQNPVKVASVRQESRVEEISIESDGVLAKTLRGADASQQPNTSTQANTTQAPKSKKRKLQPAKADELNSDELAIGLPKEQYKPRPTRSRSGYAALDQPPAPSARPEKTTRPKCRKTDSAAMQITKDAELDKVEVITLMGFRPSQAARALEESNGEVEGAVEQLLSKVDAEPGPQQSQPPLQAVDQPKEKPADTIPDQTDARPPNPEPDGAASTQLPSKPKRKSSSRTVTEQNHNEANPATQAERPGQGKRGRGRPRKATLPQDQQATNALPDEGDAKASRATETIQTAHAGDENKPDQSILREMEPNSAPTRATDKAPQPPPTATPPDDPAKLLDSAAKEPSDTAPLRTPQKGTGTSSTAKDKNKGPTSHSPIDKAKVPLRVGLSKRARIAPLLRVVKK